MSGGQRGGEPSATVAPPPQSSRKIYLATQAVSLFRGEFVISSLYHLCFHGSPHRIVTNDNPTSYLILHLYRHRILSPQFQHGCVPTISQDFLILLRICVSREPASYIVLCTYACSVYLFICVLSESIVKSYIQNAPV